MWVVHVLNQSLLLMGCRCSILECYGAFIGRWVRSHVCTISPVPPTSRYEVTRLSILWSRSEGEGRQNHCFGSQSWPKGRLAKDMLPRGRETKSLM